LGTEQLRLTPTGNLGVGTNNPTEKLQVTGNIKLSGLVKMDGITTAERDALTPQKGDIIYNTTTDKHQGYNGSWNDLY
jgi:hypothetical protein